MVLIEGINNPFDSNFNTNPNRVNNFLYVDDYGNIHVIQEQANTYSVQTTTEYTYDANDDVILSKTYQSGFTEGTAQFISYTRDGDGNVTKRETYLGAI
jgi:hypothetical protein